MTLEEILRTAEAIARTACAAYMSISSVPACVWAWRHPPEAHPGRVFFLAVVVWIAWPWPRIRRMPYPVPPAPEPEPSRQARRVRDLTPKK